jgi:transposase
MLSQEQLMEVHVLKKQGVSIRGIALKLELSRNTVRRYLREGLTIRQYKKRLPKVSKLEAHKSYLLSRIEAARPHWIPAVVLYQEIKARGYDGRLGILRNWLKPFKIDKTDPVVRFETPPGQQLQVDFTTIYRGKKPLKAFVATLGFSRMSFVWFTTHERQEAWLEGLRRAFDYFGGVPQTVLFDNAKAIMLNRDAYGVGQHRWHPALLQLAKDDGFLPKACRPYRAKTKGKVERFNGYLKQSFITPLAARLKQSGCELDVVTANAEIGAWLETVANCRVHGTTKEQPNLRFIRERDCLQALPQIKQTLGVITPQTFCATPTQDWQPVKPAMPASSLQHDLSIYDALLEYAP